MFFFKKKKICFTIEGDSRIRCGSRTRMFSNHHFTVKPCSQVKKSLVISEKRAECAVTVAHHMISLFFFAALLIFSGLYNFTLNVNNVSVSVAATLSITQRVCSQQV